MDGQNIFWKPRGFFPVLYAVQDGTARGGPVLDMQLGNPIELNDLFYQVDDPVGEAPFIVIPGQDLDQIVIDDLGI